jgi:hypothetical protein
MSALFQIIRHYYLVVALAAVALQSCSEKGYFVSPDGDDANAGTRRDPFRTISKVNSLKLVPGDIVLFEGGKSFEGTLNLVANGTIADSITITSYGEGRAIIDGQNAEALIIRGSFFNVQDIRALGAGRKTGNRTNGVSLIDASNASVRNIQTEGFPEIGTRPY